MARVVEEELPEMPGQEAFLDVLTNMVGIIIMLVVVVGIRASRAAIQAAAEKEPIPVVEKAASKEALLDARRSALTKKQDAESLIQQVVDVHQEALLREKERNYLSTYVAAFEQELKDRRTELSTDEQ